MTITFIQQHMVWFVLAAIWSLIWKGLALWRAGRLNKPVWFVVLLVVNTLGILDILYLYVFSKPLHVNN